MPIAVPTLIQRIHTHLIDERINSADEANAEIELMTKLELVEVISFVLEDMLAGRPTMAPGKFPGDREQRALRATRDRNRAAASVGSERSHQSQK